jgi:ribonuclease D
LVGLQEHDIDIRGKVRCSMLASRLLTNGIPKTQHGLAHVAKRYLDLDISKEQQASNWGADVLSQAQLEYAAKDIEVLLELDQILDQRITSESTYGSIHIRVSCLTSYGSNVENWTSLESFCT